MNNKTYHKLILFLIIWFGIHYGTNAQNSGFRGKKLSAGYNFCVSSALFNSSSQGTSVFNTGGSAGQSIFSFNTMHAVTIDYALKRRLSIGACYAYMNTSYDGKDEIYYYENTSYWHNRAVNSYDIKVNSIGINIKLFGEAYIAPLGKYVKLDILVKSITSTYDPKVFFIKTGNYNGDILRPIFGNTKQTYIKPEVLFSFGRQRIYFNRLIIDFGIRASSNIILMPFRFFANFGDDDKRFDEKVYIETTSINRVRKANMLNYYGGISFLIF